MMHITCNMETVAQKSDKFSLAVLSHGTIWLAHALFQRHSLDDSFIFNSFSYTALQVNFDMVWDKNCVELVYLSRKIVF